MAVFRSIRQLRQITAFQRSLLPAASGSYLSATPVRHSSFKSSEMLTPELQEQFNQKNIEVLSSPPEWKYVERILASGKIVPPAPDAENFKSSSGWQPQKNIEDLKANFPYYVNRTKNHQVPVYLTTTHRGNRKITKLRRIEGDIWALEQELKNYLEKKLQKRVETRVNEVSQQIDFKGIHVDMISGYLLERGF